MVFINPHWSLGSLADDGSLATTNNETFSEEQPTILDQFTLAIKNSLKKLGLFIENGIAKINELVAKKITAKKLCLEGDDGETICVDKNQLKELLTNPIQNINGSSGSSGGSDGSSDNAEPEPEPEPEQPVVEEAEPEPEPEPTPEPEPEIPAEIPAENVTNVQETP